MTATQVVNRYMNSYTTLRTGTATRVAGLWERLGGFEDADAVRFATEATRVVEGAEAATARLVSGYFATLGQAVTGRMLTYRIDVKKLTGTAVRGVNPLDVYQRPVGILRGAMGNGKLYVDAFKEAANYAATLADTDVVLTQRAAAAEVGSQDPRIVGYSRVLTGASCEFCATISTRRYHSADLLPVHAHCDCGVAPIYADEDPVAAHNETIKGDTDVPVAVHTHGEYGAVVTSAADNFTGPGDV